MMHFLTFVTVCIVIAFGTVNGATVIRQRHLDDFSTLPPDESNEIPNDPMSSFLDGQPEAEASETSEQEGGSVTNSENGGGQGEGEIGEDEGIIAGSEEKGIVQNTTEISIPEHDGSDNNATDQDGLPSDPGTDVQNSSGGPSSLANGIPGAGNTEEKGDEEGSESGTSSTTSGMGENQIAAPSATPGFGGSAEAPTAEAPTAESPTAEAPTAGQISSPMYSSASSPTENRPTYAAPTRNYPVASPTDNSIPYPSAVYNPPTLRPAVPYVSSDDDPLKEGDDIEGDSDKWTWNDSTLEEMEHDKTVIIALSAVFGVMFFFAIFVAYQMLENPEGCCASICRITVACFCGILRCVCYPCRAMCGCTGSSDAQHMIVPGDGHFTHDLELS